MDKFRGHEIQKVNDKYIYSDTKENVADTWMSRSCGHCGLHNTVEGYDGCIGKIEHAINACCGHGDANDAYVQYSNHSVYGEDAMDILRYYKVIK